MAGEPMWLLLGALVLLAPHLSKNEGNFFALICLLAAFGFIAVEALAH